MDRTIITRLSLVWHNDFIIGLIDNDADGLGFAAFGKQPTSRFQIFRFNPFAARIKRMDAVGSQGLAVADAIWKPNTVSDGILIV